MAASKNGYPTYTVFAILPRPDDVLGGERPARWVDVGVGFKNSDESISVKLELMPTSPGIVLQLRPYELPEARKAKG